jgi:hypothetical protein
MLYFMGFCFVVFVICILSVCYGTYQHIKEFGFDIGLVYPLFLLFLCGVGVYGTILAMHAYSR